MPDKRVPLYERLPEIYRLRDAEQIPPYPLRNYLQLVEELFGGIHENIETLYHDFFIETCAHWAVPYIGDLLGASHIKGEAWTQRADVADTIALRRRKGTLSAMEQLAYDLTGWGAYARELRQNLVWSQPLNHLRPDLGSMYQAPMPMGGTMLVRNPGLNSFLNSPLDACAHIPDLKRPENSVRYNLPNLAVFLWRLKAYTVRASQPMVYKVQTKKTLPTQVYLVGFYVDPLGRPVQLFNVHRFVAESPASPDRMPGPILPARLNSHSNCGAPELYVAAVTAGAADAPDASLLLHIPENGFSHVDWIFRGADLSAWGMSMNRALNPYEVAIDPMLGRIIMAVESGAQAKALGRSLRLTYTYGAAGPVGSHPITFSAENSGETIIFVSTQGESLASALGRLPASGPCTIEIQDSDVHDLKLSQVSGTMHEDEGYNLALKHSLTIRAADHQRPRIRLAQPLRFCPAQDVDAGGLTVRLEGLFITRGKNFASTEPLIDRAALNRLECINCTLDPEIAGSVQMESSMVLQQEPESVLVPGVQSPVRLPGQPPIKIVPRPRQTALCPAAINLSKGYGFAKNSARAKAFAQIPEIVLERCITGPLWIDSEYSLSLADTVVDAGAIPARAALALDRGFAVKGAGATLKNEPAYGPPTTINGVTVLGRMRVEQLSGSGGIWTQQLEVMDNQQGSIQFSCFSGEHDRLPPNFGCVDRKEAELRFVSETFGAPGYAQLAMNCDERIRSQGPKQDAMGAFGFLLESHGWANLQIRYREFLPASIRLLLLPVT